MPLKDLRALEERLDYLEGAMTALSQSRQHINTRRICVSDDSGAETCITKAQLDAVLVSQSHMEASHPAEIIDAAKVPGEPAAVRASQKGREPDETGTITVTSSSAEMKPAPEAEISAVQGVATTEDTETVSKTVSTEILRDQVPAELGAATSAPGADLNRISDPEISARGDLP